MRPIRRPHIRLNLGIGPRPRSPTSFLRLSAEDFHERLKSSPGFRRYCEERSAVLVNNARRLYQRHLTSTRDFQSLDSPLSALVRAKPVICRPDTTVRRVLLEMAGRNADTAVMVDDHDRPVGLFTLDDVLRRIAIEGYGQDRPIADVTTPSLCHLPAHALGSEAVMAMVQSGQQQVAVVDDGKLVGLVRERDLFALQRVGLAEVADAIAQADTADTVVQCSAEVRRLSHNLLDQGVRAEQLTRIIATLNDHIVIKLIELNQRAFAIGDIRYSWLSLGSEGRHEQTMSSDQDNAILFACPSPDAAEQIRARLLPFAQQVNQALDRCGFALCKGGIMAGNPTWCLSLDEWERQFRRWISTPTPNAVLNSTIFFDFRHLHGDAELAVELRRRISGPAQTNRRFLHLMAENALARTPPLGMLRDFVTDGDGTLDLKLAGITLFVDAARIMSLAHGVPDPGTYQRLQGGGRVRNFSDKDISAWLVAFDFLQQLRLRIQHHQYFHGQPLTNRLAPAELNDLDRRFLVESLRQAGKLQKTLQYYRIRES